MRTFLWRHRRKLTWITLPVSLIALALLLIGSKDASLPPLVALIVLLQLTEAIIDWRCKPPPPVLSEDEKSAVQVTRDSVDEVTAIRMLRAAHPDMGLLEAAVFVRKL